MFLNKIGSHGLYPKGVKVNVSVRLIEEVNNLASFVLPRGMYNSLKQDFPFNTESNIGLASIDSSEEVVIPDEISDFFDKIYLDFYNLVDFWYRSWKYAPIYNWISEKYSDFVGTNDNVDSFDICNMMPTREDISLIKEELTTTESLFEEALNGIEYNPEDFSTMQCFFVKGINKRAKKNLLNLYKIQIKNSNLIHLQMSKWLYHLDISLSYTKDNINFSILKEDSLLFANLIKLYNQDILDKKYILDILRILFLHNLGYYLCFKKNIEDRKRLILNWIFALEIIEIEKKFISNSVWYPFQIIKNFFWVDFNEKVGIDFINSLVWVKLRDISPDEKRKSIWRIVLQNHRLFCRKESIGYPKLFDYLCSDLSQEKYLSIEKYLLENKWKKLSQENLLFLFENNLEIYDLGEKRALTICKWIKFEFLICILYKLSKFFLALLLIPLTKKHCIVEKSSGLYSIPLRASSKRLSVVVSSSFIKEISSLVGIILQISKLSTLSFVPTKSEYFSLIQL